MVRVQSNVVAVLERMLFLARCDECFAIEFSEGLDEMLDVLLENDVFGSEGQNDPRGDQRHDPYLIADAVDETPLSEWGKRFK